MGETMKQYALLAQLVECPKQAKAEIGNKTREPEKQD